MLELTEIGVKRRMKGRESRQASVRPFVINMQQLNCAVTTFLFVAHAILGCCAHHASGHVGERHIQCEASHADDGCLADEHGKSHEPASDGGNPVAPCQHGQCSFVKVEPVGIDSGLEQVLWAVATSPSLTDQIDEPRAAIHRPTYRANLPSAQLYVCYCALLI